MSAVAMHCERLNHHVEWSNVYEVVEVRLTTHDRGGVTSLDTTLALLMEDLAND
jgi:4a-hydroxytetrahydrobiopterin dehydratase